MLSCFWALTCAISQAGIIFLLPVPSDNNPFFKAHSECLTLGEHDSIPSVEMNHSSLRPSREHCSHLTSESTMGAWHSASWWAGSSLPVQGEKTGQSSSPSQPPPNPALWQVLSMADSSSLVMFAGFQPQCVQTCTLCLARCIPGWWQLKDWFSAKGGRRLCAGKSPATTCHPLRVSS